VGQGKPVKLFAPAKINLGLSILHGRNDGYHELHSLMTTLSVGDELELEAKDQGIALEVIGSSLGNGPDNLVYCASEQYLAAIGGSKGVDLRLHKHLPIAAGLGGGSSDAAAALRGLARLYPSDLDLFKLAKSLGADVPFLLQGGAAIARGIGEVLTPIELPVFWVVLANPGLHISAAEAYRGLNRRFGPELDIREIIRCLADNRPPPYFNSLEQPVFEAYPLVYEVRATLEKAGLTGVMMSGSGSTVFGLAKNSDWATGIAAELAQSYPNWWVRAANNSVA
jgi:4-diphosphocytidyl-2-C-methyl-D-erythritol kinase